VDSLPPNERNHWHAASIAATWRVPAHKKAVQAVLAATAAMVAPAVAAACMQRGEASGVQAATLLLRV
jgi:hypothetical protein